MNVNHKLELTSVHLHIIAMICMLLDHVWVVVTPKNMDWLNCVGRIAFPIYAFLIVEGYFKTKDRSKFFKRLLITAVISEIPFNLMISGSILFPLAQNVIWTLAFGILFIHIFESIKSKHIVLIIAVGIISFEIIKIIGTLFMIDYGYAGIYTVLVFYLFRQKNLWNLTLQILSLTVIINVLGGYTYELALSNGFISFPRQAFMIIALIPIWMYNGEYGESPQYFKEIYRSFYPVHMILLSLIRIF